MAERTQGFDSLRVRRLTAESHEVCNVIMTLSLWKLTDCQISERLDRSKPESCDFETSRHLTVNVLCTKMSSSFNSHTFSLLTVMLSTWTHWAVSYRNSCLKVSSRYEKRINTHCASLWSVMHTLFWKFVEINIMSRARRMYIFISMYVQTIIA